MSYKIEPTEKTPEVSIDTDNGKVSIKGVSVPDNPYDFYQDMLDSIDEYLQAPNESTEIEFHLEYFNTSTALVIRNLLRKLESQSGATSLSIKWIYEEDDEDMMEAGSEFQFLFKDLDFKLLESN